MTINSVQVRGTAVGGALRPRDERSLDLPGAAYGPHRAFGPTGLIAPTFDTLRGTALPAPDRVTS